MNNTAPSEKRKPSIVSCSQCGEEFGIGLFGYSHCEDHEPNPLDIDQGWDYDFADDDGEVA